MNEKVQYKTDMMSQFVMLSMTYEKSTDMFRQKKNKLFNTEKYSTQNSDDYNVISRAVQTQNNQKISLKAKRFILRLNSTAQLSNIQQDKINLYSNIIVLDISNSRVITLPDTLTIIIPNLLVLNLQNNLIQEIPKFIYNIQLQQLNINNNLLKSLQVSNVWQNKLEKFDVGKNHIRELPIQLWNCEKLIQLDIRSNDFDRISFNVLNIRQRLNILGLDWIKYTHTQYKSQRSDLMSDDSLQIFWQVIDSLYNESILRQQIDSECSDMELSQDHSQQFVDSYDFINRFDQFYEQNIEIKKRQQQNQSIQEEDESNDSIAIFNELDRNQQINQYQANDRMYTGDLDLCLNEKKKEQNQEQFNIMHIAVNNEDLGILRSYIQNNFELSSSLDQHGHSPLSLAIQEEKYHCAKILLNSRLDINVGGGALGSCLNQAISKNQYFLVRDLIAMKININKTDNMGNGPIHYLMGIFRKNQQEAQKLAYLLIDQGTNVNLQNKNGITPLQIAIKRSIYQGIKFAYQYNLDRGLKIFDFKVKTKVEQYNLIHLAAKAENLRILLFLLKIIPQGIFEHSTDGFRPYDIVQKNFTLSKVLQTFENRYIQNYINRMLFNKVALVNKQPLLDQCDKQNSIDQIADENDGNQQISQDLLQMTLNPKFKYQKIEQKQINSENEYSKLKNNKIPKEQQQEIVKQVKYSFKQNNNLTCVEKLNKNITQSFNLSDKNQLSGALLNRQMNKIKNNLIYIDHLAENLLNEQEIDIILECSTLICLWHWLSKIYQINFQSININDQEINHQISNLSNKIEKLGQLIFSNKKQFALHIQEQLMQNNHNLLFKQNDQQLNQFIQYELYQKLY